MSSISHIIPIVIILLGVNFRESALVELNESDEIIVFCSAGAAQ